MVSRLAAYLLLFSLAGCAAVPMAPPDLDVTAKQFQPPPGYANLYVVQGGRSALFQVLLDGRLAGAVGHQSYLMVPVAPGTHMITSIAGENQANLSLTVGAGQNYFVRIFPKMGWMLTRVGLEMLDGAAGREAVMATTRVAAFGP